MSDAPHTPASGVDSPRPKSLGEILKGARLSRGMELGDVAELTHVRKDYLRALEEGDYGQLPEDVYSRNFLRLYAQSVGLDSDKLMDAYLHERRLALGASAAEVRSEEPRRRERGEDPARRRLQVGTWLPTLLLVAFVVVLAVWGFRTLLFSPGQTTTFTPVDPTPTVPQVDPPALPTTPEAGEPAPATPVLDEVLIDIDTAPPGAQVTIDGFPLPGTTPLRSIPVTPRANRLVRITLEGHQPFEQSFDLSFGRPLTITLTPETVAELPPAAAPANPAEAAPAASQGQIAIEITEPTWLEVYQSTARNSGDRLVYTTVQPGERFVFDLPVYVHVGNAAGVQVTVAGQELGVLGSSGAVLGRAFNP